MPSRAPSGLLRRMDRKVRYPTRRDALVLVSMAALGALIGAIIGAVIYASDPEAFIDFGRGFNAIAGAMLGGLVGLGVGWMIVVIRP